MYDGAPNGTRVAQLLHGANSEIRAAARHEGAIIAAGAGIGRGHMTLICNDEPPTASETTRA